MTFRGKVAFAVLALALAFLAGYLHRRSRVPSAEEEVERAAERARDAWRDLAR